MNTNIYKANSRSVKNCSQKWEGLHILISKMSNSEPLENYSRKKKNKGYIS